MFGPAAQDWTIVLIDQYRGFLLAILPPGAFIGLGLMIVVKNIIDDKLAKPVVIPSVQLVSENTSNG